jgi:hypothetical protein
MIQLVPPLEWFNFVKLRCHDVRFLTFRRSGQGVHEDGSQSLDRQSAGMRARKIRIFSHKPAIIYNNYFINGKVTAETDRFATVCRWERGSGSNVINVEMRTEVEWRCLRTSAVETEVVVTIGILQRVGPYADPCGRQRKVTLFRTHFFGRWPWRHLLVCLVS